MKTRWVLALALIVIVLLAGIGWLAGVCPFGGPCPFGGKTPSPTNEPQLTCGHPPLSIDQAGNLRDAQGKINYYVIQATGHVEQNKLERYGKLWRGKYPDEYRYLYEGPMDEGYFQKTGVNMMHFYSEQTTLAAAFPEYAPEKLPHFFEFYHEMLKKYDAEKLNRQWGQKAYQDYIDNLRTFTHTPGYWNMTACTSLVLRTNPEITSRFLKPGAIADNPQGSASSVSCDLSSPEGRALMKKLFTAELDWFKMVGVQPFACKLYNEPSYENYSPFARKDFAEWLKGQFATVEAMNQAWGTSYASFAEPWGRKGDKAFSLGAGIELRKMNERRYADMTNELAALAREKYGLPSFVQLMGGIKAVTLEHGNNVYLLHTPREIIVSGTGNYAFSSLEEYDDATPARDALSVSKDMKLELLRHELYYPLAKGKPYLDTENYVAQAKAPFFRAVMWREVALGKPSVLFWQLAGMEAPGKKQPVFALLYPDVVQPQEFAVWKTMPQELEKTGGLFLDRRNKLYAPQAGFLYSNATLRRAAFGPSPEGLGKTLDVVAALHFSYYDCAGAFEENLKEVLPGFKVFFLGDVTNTTQEASGLLLDFARRGGTLFVSGAVPKDEYDRPLAASPWEGLEFAATAKTSGVVPEFGVKAIANGKIAAGEGWRVTATLNGQPVMAEKTLGKGKVVALTAQLSDYALAEVLKPLMAERGVKPYGQVLKADKDEAMPNIELFAFREPGQNPPRCWLSSLWGRREDDKARHGWLLFNHNQETKQFRLAVPPRFATVWDPVKGERYPVNGGFAEIVLSPLDCAVIIANDPRESGELVAPEALTKRLAEKRQEDNAKKLTRKSTVVDFSKQANIGFDNAQKWPTDSVFIEGDHKYLIGVPFHKQVFGDVVFDVIRFDYNSNRTCITLKSARHPDFPESVTVPVERQGGDVMLLASSVGGKDGDLALSVKLSYADGTAVTQKLFKGKEIGDWKIDRNPEELRRQAVWRDPQGYGLFLTEVHNPHPAKLLSSITLVAAANDVAPVIGGISILDTIFKKEYQNSVPLSEVFPELKSKVKNARNSWENNFFQSEQLYTELSTKDGKPSPYLDAPEKIDRCVIRGAVRITRDETGKLEPHTWFTVTIPDSGRRFMHDCDFMSNFFQNKAPGQWVEFEIPLKEFRGKATGIAHVNISPGRPAGIMKQIRDLRLEW